MSKEKKWCEVAIALSVVCGVLLCILLCIQRTDSPAQIETKFSAQGPRVFLWEMDNYLEALDFDSEELDHAKIMVWGTPTPTPRKEV